MENQNYTHNDNTIVDPISRHRAEIMGLAMIMIMFCHSNVMIQNPFWEDTYKILKTIAQVGVDIFLFLSGIGCYYSYKRCCKIFRFYKRRAVRIFPTYLLIVTVRIVLDVALDGYTYTGAIQRNSLISFFASGELVTWFIPALYDTIKDCRSEASERSLQELPEKMKSRPVICKKWVLLGVSSFIIWFSRSNGKYIIIATILLTLLMVRKNVKKYLLVLFIMLVIDKGAFSVLTSLNPYDCAMRESSGILLNQISAVVATEGNVSSEDREFIDQILPYDLWGAFYTPSFIDPL
ncbi:MAG: DUF6020 family protein, partial [Oscillospiraceae bacterium]|nr:DUF6020 family protein [Oscillospiraceae bacterium]